MKIAVIHGPNLRLLGRREPEVYGTETLDDVDARLTEVADELGIEVESFQSNHEGEILDFVDEAPGRRIPHQPGSPDPHVHRAP